MADFQAQMNALVGEFVQQIEGLARDAATRLVEAGVSAARAAIAQASRGRGTPPPQRPAAPATPLRAAPATARPAAPAGRAKGEKRPATAVASLKQNLRAFIGANPGLRVEQINAALGTTTREAMLPLRKLVADGLVRKEGEKRSTRYYLTTASPTPAAAPTGPLRRRR